MSGNPPGCPPWPRIPPNPQRSPRTPFASDFCHPESIPTRPSFLACHNWRQISGLLDGQMGLYGIAEGTEDALDSEVRGGIGCRDTMLCPSCLEASCSWAAV